MIEEVVEPATELEKILWLCAKELAKSSEAFTAGRKVKKFVTHNQSQDYPNCNSVREPKVYRCGAPGK